MRYEEAQCNAHIVLVTGEKLLFRVNAATTVGTALAETMKATGYLTLWNSDATLCVPAEEVRYFELKRIKE